MDVGTDNHALFADPLYMGWKRTRLRGKNYEWVARSGVCGAVADINSNFVDKFIANCRDIFPNAIIHVGVHSSLEN